MAVTVREDDEVISPEFRRTMKGVSFEPALSGGHKVKSGVLEFWHPESPGRTQSGVEKDRSVHADPGHNVLENFA
jgi:hypothetical protein